MSKSIEIFIDGASRGNPGLSGIGVVFFENKKIVKELYKFIGETTNNIAEYTALIYALQEALINRYEQITVKSDSELLVKQVNGDYKVKNKGIKPYYEQYLHLLRGFKGIIVVHIPRKENSSADKLANKAIDSRLDSSFKTKEEASLF